MIGHLVMGGSVMRSSVLSVAMWLGAAVAGGIAASPAQAQNNVLFIFDASGSMKVAAGPESRMTVAKKAMNQALKDVPADVRLGLLMYGHRRANDCKDIELVSPIGADDAATINAKIQSAEAKGETPIAEALRQAARSFAALKGQSNSIVLVTDGIEECKGDPCAAAREIKAAGLDLKAHVVGFALNDQQRKAVQCIADLTGGKYFEARDASGLNRALGEVKQQTAAAAPPPSPPQPPAKPNLLLQANGGQVLAAPNDRWLQTNDGKEEQIVWFVTGTEAIYGFKDGRPATFDAFSVLIPGSSGNNVKEFELLVGDDSPVGTFRSIGRFSTQNLKLMQTPYQEFKFEAVTAKYLKVKLLSAHNGIQGNEIKLHEFRLVGQLAEASAAPPPAPPATPGRVNLLDQANGGQVLAAPSDIWLQTNDGKEQEIVWFVTGTEAIYGFKDERAATFEAFSVLVPGTSGNNLKEFELLVGDESPVGTFRSIGKFSTQNLKMMQSPYQEFKFDPVTAKYLKVKLLSAHNGIQGREIKLQEFRLMGQLAQASDAPRPAASPRPAAGRTNLLDQANGGQVLAAPSDIWLQTNDGKEQEIVWFVTGTEAIYGFKDERAATFDTFAVLVPGSSGNHLKEFELLVGDESPVGTFRSIGKFSTQNLKMMQSPYQEFKFEPVTAKYLKVKLLSAHNGIQGREIKLQEFRLMGLLAATTASTGAAATPRPAVASTSPPAAGRVNLLDQANGGQVLAAPNDRWLQTNDGKEQEIVWFATGTEAIYAFKDERAATFDTFAVLVPGSSGNHLKEFELLVGDESPVGTFRSIGKFSTQNLKMMQSPYQEFKFEPVTAKYLKVKLLSAHNGIEGNEIKLQEFRMMGTLQ
jgi:hypothetical protein